MGCCSFKRRTNPPSSTTEECPPWLYSFLPEDCQCQSAPVTRGCALRKVTHGNLLGHEPDHRAPPPLKLLAESRTPGLRRGGQRDKVGRKRGRISPPFLPAPFQTGQDTFASSGSPVALVDTVQDRYGSPHLAYLPTLARGNLLPFAVGTAARVDGFPVRRLLRKLCSHRVRTP
jgi:hypothetical protein